MARAAKPTPKPARSPAKRPKAQPSPPSPAVSAETPLLEWLAAIVGGVLTLAALGVMVVEIARGQSRPPEFLVRGEGVVEIREGYLLELRVDNIGDRPASQVEIEGVIPTAGGEEVAGVTLEDVPARSTRRGGLIFKTRPSARTVELRVLGYAQP